jgi:valyl-tRNA synthetase
VIWYPGFDHAGIATQTVVEKHLLKNRNLKRTDMSRERFLQHCNRWKDKWELYNC